MGARGLSAPVLVFALDEHAAERKRRALAARAAAFTYRWDSLLREIDRIFSPPHETM
jgi:hypothetical protein